MKTYDRTMMLSHIQIIEQYVYDLGKFYYLIGLTERIHREISFILFCFCVHKHRMADDTVI